MPRGKSTTAVATPAAVAAPAPVAPVKTRARKVAAPAAEVVPEATPEVKASKPKKEFSLVVSSVEALNGPAFNGEQYLAGHDSGNGKKSRVYRNFSGTGPLQAARKAFTQIRKFVGAETCSYRFGVADPNGKETQYTFSCAPRDLSDPEVRKKYTITKKGKDGSTTEFVDRWVITHDSPNSRRKAPAETPVQEAPAPVVQAPAPVQEAPKKGGRKAAAK